MSEREGETERERERERQRERELFLCKLRTSTNKNKIKPTIFFPYTFNNHTPHLWDTTKCLWLEVPTMDLE